jgi:hypothetical protein
VFGRPRPLDISSRGVPNTVTLSTIGPLSKSKLQKLLCKTTITSARTFPKPYFLHQIRRKSNDNSHMLKHWQSRLSTSCFDDCFQRFSQPALAALAAASQEQAECIGIVAGDVGSAKHQAGYRRLRNSPSTHKHQTIRTTTTKQKPVKVRPRWRRGEVRHNTDCSRALPVNCCRIWISAKCSNILRYNNKNRKTQQTEQENEPFLSI